MSIVKSSKRYLWHGLACARCGIKKSVRTKTDEALPNKVFTAMGEYLCQPCWKTHDPQQGGYITSKKSKLWVQEVVVKKTLRQQLVESKGGDGYAL
jgi:hypothetical protein